MKSMAPVPYSFAPADESFFRSLLESHRADRTAGFAAASSRLRSLYESPDDFDEESLSSASEDVLCWISEHERTERLRVEEALSRLATGNYGSCLYCRQSIDRARLEALPDTWSCLHCQELIESGRLDPDPSDFDD